MRVVISKLQESDKQEWFSLYRAYAEFYQVPMTDEILNNVWSWVFDTTESFYALVARMLATEGDDSSKPGEMIGFMHYRGMRSPLRGCSVGFLDDLYITPAHRGDGVVDSLFSVLEKESQLHGWPFVRWITAPDNARARSVYDHIAKQTPWVMYQLATN